jgi:predicted chitinase
MDMFGDNRLLLNPDQVADTESLSWGTAFWFWRKNVGKNASVRSGYFGASTKIINGGLECGGGAYQDKARKRYEIYKKVLKEFRVNEIPIENGCYN